MLQMSAAGPIGAPTAACSGAIHAGVPSTATVASGPETRALAIPKSRTLTVKESVAWRERAKKMLAGLRIAVNDGERVCGADGVRDLLDNREDILPGEGATSPHLAR